MEEYIRKIRVCGGFSVMAEANGVQQPFVNVPPRLDGFYYLLIKILLK
ncbi:hypothetical protein [Halorussus pelagicus]|nr:hypothetical protein [Halorussus pelagicus]